MNSNTPLPGQVSNNIPLNQAKAMTGRYRENKDVILKDQYDKNILPICETFDANAISNLVSLPNCASIRVYYGMSDDLYIHAILVAVDEAGEDILPSEGVASAQAETTTDPNPTIVEDGLRCPTYCPRSIL